MRKQQLPNWQTKASQFQPFANQLEAMVALNKIGFIFEGIEPAGSPQAQTQRQTDPHLNASRWLELLNEDEAPSFGFDVSGELGFAPLLPYPSLGLQG
ncbi:MAG TPA: hypothetical protein PLB32_03690 [Acidobacteriota bacterium]|nr:hypothetical protein [Acidobacteriota bacterium]